MIALYFHIPYCIRKCRYCDFCSFPVDETAGRYCDALLTEIELRRKQYPSEQAATAFFGGGTPTVLPADALCRVLDAANEAFPFSRDAEISIECNPKTASADALKALRRAGFNRLSIGLQSANDAILRRIGRVHTYTDFLHTYEWARGVGFANINIDVMHGLPGQTQDDYLQTLEAVSSLVPEHISAYSLILEEGTPLYRDVATGRESLPDEDAVADMQDAGMAYLWERGFERYEISNFARPGYRCRHNLTYWHNESYLGFGVAAHSSMREGTKQYRFANPETIPAYVKPLAKGRLPESERILINTFEQMFECVMLGLRLTGGVDDEAFRNRFGVSVFETYPEAIERNRRRSLWDETDPRFLRLNARGLDLLNTVLLDFKEPDYWELLLP